MIESQWVCETLSLYYYTILFLFIFQSRPGTASTTPTLWWLAFSSIKYLSIVILTNSQKRFIETYTVFLILLCSQRWQAVCTNSVLTSPVPSNNWLL